ncbi:glycine-rich domain-containing protein [Azohydromonas aeria]|uniref:glycine-rich domain-containing protein n=1 Tax=Azohydromonas aeria TaxID=2590212 RepID=UPI0012FAD1EC|nr:glycine-rich domain-containing protein-like [Azohydromonas aeria]
MSYIINKEEFGRAMNLVSGWNFDLATRKLLESKPEIWTLDRAEKAVESYKRYMAVTKALGGVQLVPNADIDEIWHMHILDTRAYMKDCTELFGEYLHHFPYFGMLGEENKQQWLAVQTQSEALWQEMFGELLYQGSDDAQKCPQVCPCNIGQTGYAGATHTSVMLAA